jgi:hypothetical protein
MIAKSHRSMQNAAIFATPRKKNVERIGVTVMHALDIPIRDERR